MFSCAGAGLKTPFCRSGPDGRPSTEPSGSLTLCAKVPDISSGSIWETLASSRQAELCGHHSLRLIFNDGTSKRVDVLPLLEGPIFMPLRDPEYFARMTLDPLCGTVCWPNGADFAPEALHELPAEETDESTTGLSQSTKSEIGNKFEILNEKIQNVIGTSVSPDRLPSSSRTPRATAVSDFGFPAFIPELRSLDTRSKSLTRQGPLRIFDGCEVPPRRTQPSRNPPMHGLPFRSTTLVLTALIASGTLVRADGPGPVRVTIWEKLPEPWSWQPPAGRARRRLRRPGHRLRPDPGPVQPAGDRGRPVEPVCTPCRGDPRGCRRPAPPHSPLPQCGAARRRWPGRGRDEPGQAQLRGT